MSLVGNLIRYPIITVTPVIIFSILNTLNCHQMSYFKSKMHQIRFRLGLGPRPRRGAYSVPPDSLAGFTGPTSKGRGGNGTGGEGRGEEGSTREGRGREPEGSGKGGKGKREGSEGIGSGGRGRRMGIAHPLFSA